MKEMEEIIFLENQMHQKQGLLKKHNYQFLEEKYFLVKEKDLVLHI